MNTTQEITKKAELRRVKVARYLSEETTAFSAQLWVDGEYIADVSNEGRGGNNRIMHRYDGKKLHTLDKVEAFEAWCKTQPSHTMAYTGVSDAPDAETFTIDMTADYCIDLMLEAHQEEKQIKRWCRTKTVIRLDGDGPGVFHTYNRPYTPTMAQRIRDGEPKLAEILNERYI